MKRSVFSYFVSCFIVSSFLFNGMDACWGNEAPNYGVTSEDYDLLVGSNLVVNCSLYEKDFSDNGKIIDSSDLIIEKDTKNMSQFTRVIDNRTIQLKISAVTVEDSGMYVCKLLLSNGNPTVCGTKVSVGYPPNPIETFSCISRNFENINCSWSTEANNINTKYNIFLNLYNEKSWPQKCPNITANSNFCEWSKTTNPPLTAIHRNLSFTITGSNSLGLYEKEFTVDLFSSVILNSPENLEFSNISVQSATVEWKQPTITYSLNNFRITYEIWLSEVSTDSSEVTIYETENTSLLLEYLMPYIEYNVSIRCRSAFTENDDLWSNFTTKNFKTLADVPYKAPVVIPEAYEIHTFDDYRSASLYWKNVPKLHHNGEDFHYRIQYYQSNPNLSNTSEIYSFNSSIPYIFIKNLQKNVSYIFHIHSANEKGISKDYGTIVIDSQDKIPSSPKNVKVISQESGLYNISWSPPNDMHTFGYVVFWCSSRTPWKSRCDKSIQWINEGVSNTSVLLYFYNPYFKSNYQFAVVSKLENRSSSMEWASPLKSGLPNPIKTFSCISENFENLKCTWSTEKNIINAKYNTFLNRYNEKSLRQRCPKVTANSCEWSKITAFMTYNRVLSFTVIGKNKLGKIENDFTVDLFTSVILNSPENLEILNINMQSVIIKWKPPTITSLVKEFRIFYEIRLSEVSNDSSGVKLYKTENTSLLLENLIPYIEYNASVRCRSAFTENDDLWSNFTSRNFKNIG